MLTLKKNLDQIIAKNGPAFKIDKKTGAHRQFCSTPITFQDKPLVVKMTGDLFMKPYRNDHEDYGTAFSIGISFTDTAVLDRALETVREFLTLDDGWVVKDVFDEGKMFLKLKPTKQFSGWEFTSNIQFKPNKLEHDKIDTGMEVTVELVVSGWYSNRIYQNMEVLQYGLTTKLKDIHFGPQPVKKKRKTDEEEVSYDCDYNKIVGSR